MKFYFEKRLSFENMVCAALSLLLVGISIAAIVVAVNTTSESTGGRQLDSMPSWGYEYDGSLCKRVELTSDNLETLMTLPKCNLMNVEFGTLLPRPTGNCKIAGNAVGINVSSISVSSPIYENQLEMWKESEARFLRIINSKNEETDVVLTGTEELEVEITVLNNDISMTLETDESYELKITRNENRVLAEISGKTYFGARHGLESLGQLIVYDEFDKQFIIPSEVEITDGPVYPYRGILLDTVRHFYKVDTLKRTIDAMSLVKLNVFHWHITDSQSFPLIFESHPEFAKLGAYHPKKRYSMADIADVVAYAKIRGVRVIPELDAPSHVGEGWQHTDFVTCHNYQPWEDYCVGAPCGQLDPTKEELYGILNKMYEEMNAAFEVTDIFHMGGDEVLPQCWNTSSSVQNYITETMGLNIEEKDSFTKLWKLFQDRVQQLYKAINPKAKIMLWTSTLTEENQLEENLNKDDYIIHVWTDGTGSTSHVPHLLEKGYKIIMSNSDSFYLDCGFGSWVRSGNNWCSPYKGWHKQYDNNLAAIAGDRKDQVLGGEGCLWSSLSGEETLDSRLWPRSSAIAERLWTEPNANYRHVETRMLLHRNYLVLYGLTPEHIQPEFCLLHEKECYSVTDY